MFRPIEYLIRALHLVSGRSSSIRRDHLSLGQRGETEAYLYLRRLGYRFVAVNFRVPQNRGEIDLVGWDDGVLCFVEVKTRADSNFAPPSAAVTREKQRHILSVAHRYLRRLPGGRAPSCRFDILSIVAPGQGTAPGITLQKGAYAWDTPQPNRRRYWGFADKFARRVKGKLPVGMISSYARQENAHKNSG
jgi:putative endonuclease